jgi:hypothetical protein
VPSLDDDQSLMDAVIAYLAECPDAMDTKAGVTEWWVMRQEVRTRVDAVSRVLEKLVAAGLLEHVGTGKGAMYRLRKDRPRDARD